MGASHQQEGCFLPEWGRQQNQGWGFLPAFEEGDIEDGSVGVDELEQEGLKG